MSKRVKNRKGKRRTDQNIEKHIQYRKEARQKSLAERMQRLAFQGLTGTQS